MQNRDQLRKLFRNGQQNDSVANEALGLNFYWGKEGFPERKLVAKKHFLRAALSSIHTTAQAYILKIDVELHQLARQNQNAPVSEYSLIKAHNVVRERPYPQEILNAELTHLESQIGKLSSFEQTVCKGPDSLRVTACNFVMKHSTLFNIKSLPTELQDPIEPALPEYLRGTFSK